MHRKRHWSLQLWAVAPLALFLGLAIGLSALPALAHGGAELTVSPVTVAPGGAIQVSGEGVEAGEVFTITLVGMNYQATLGKVTVAGDEGFQQNFPVPATTPAGTYQVVATSGEGEEIAAELSIEAGTTTAGPAVPAEPSAAPMQLDRSKPTGELAALIVALLVSAGLGLVLVRGR